MKYNCFIDKITARQAAIISVIDSIFVTQAHNCIIDSFDKDEIIFVLKANLSKQQQQRLFVDKIPFYLPGYVGFMYEENRVNYLKIVKANADQQD